MGRYGLLLLCWLMQQFVYGQAGAYAALKPEVVETGDTVQLTVIVSGASGQPKAVDFTAWSEVFPAENILSKTKWRHSGSQWLQQFTLIVFDSANLKLPGLPVLTSSGKLLTTNELSLSVYPTKGAAISDMAAIRPIYREPESWLDYWPWGVAAGLLLLLFFWYLRKISRKPKPVAQPVFTPPPPVSPRSIALEKLSNLEQQQLWKKGQAKEHHAAISLILREYLEAEYGISAMESTTSEIMNLLKNTRFDSSLARALKELLSNADLVKYARSEMPESAHEAALTQAREWLGARPQTVHEKIARQEPPPARTSGGQYKPL